MILITTGKESLPLQVMNSWSIWFIIDRFVAYTAENHNNRNFLDAYDHEYFITLMRNFDINFEFW